MSTYILRKIFEKVAPRGKTPTHIVFNDRSEYRNYEDTTTPEIIITFKTIWSQWQMILFLPTGLFDGYIEGIVDIEGVNPIHKLAALGHAHGLQRQYDHSVLGIFRQNPLVWLKNLYIENMQDNIVRARAIQNAEFHYSLPVELFKYKLGETTGYSEGYWTEKTENINQAKHNLYEYVCQKLQLKPGMKVLEVGSGWGFLPIYMVKNYDVDVVVYNPVKEQNEYMRGRFKRHGVDNRIRLEFGVHGDIVREGEKVFDRFVSIGVHEHHGMNKKMYREWWHSISTVLKDRGVGVVSCTSFMSYGMTSYLTLKYIWPGGHIPSLPLEIKNLTEAGLTLMEWENLWPHYHRTLCVWRDRFKKYWLQIYDSNPKIFDERFRRRWTMYLEAILEQFEHAFDLSHLTFVKGRHVDAYPLTHETHDRSANFREGEDPVECYE